MRPQGFQRLLLLLWLSACSEEVGPTPDRPPLGRWNLTEITGEMRSQSGGTPVLCLQGGLFRLPLPLFDESQTVRSSVELASESSFLFTFYFEDGGDFDAVSNGETHRPEGFLADGFGRGALRRSGHWSWPEGRVEGLLESVSGDTERGRQEARFRVSGQFQGRSELEGSWSYQAFTNLGGCWSRSRGEGSWSAAPVGERGRVPG